MTSPDPTGTGAQSGTDPAGAQSGATDATGTEGAQSGTDTGQSAPPAGETVSRADYEAVLNRLRANDQNASKLQAELKQLKEKDMPELQRLQAALAEKEQQTVALTEANEALTVQNAFLTDNTYDWHNPTAAMQLLDREKIAIVDGKVSGMKDALLKLSKDHPYLLKPKPEKEAPVVTPPASTPPMAPGQKPGTAPNKEALHRRFPPMRTRIGS